MKVSVAMSKGDIWIPPNGRPYWTKQNARGNAGPHLTDTELVANGLKMYKHLPFDCVWAQAHGRRLV